MSVGSVGIVVTYITNTNTGPSETILICENKVDQTLHIDLSVSLGVNQSPDLVGDKPADTDEYELENININVTYCATPLLPFLSNNNFQSFKLWLVSLSACQRSKKVNQEHSKAFPSFTTSDRT